MVPARIIDRDGLGGDGDCGLHALRFAPSGAGLILEQIANGKKQGESEDYQNW